MMLGSCQILPCLKELVSFMYGLFHALLMFFQAIMGCKNTGLTTGMNRKWQLKRGTHRRQQ